MMVSDSLLRQVAEVICSATRPLLVSHVRPDGDAVGSLLGFGLALQSAGKRVQMVLADGVPTAFRHLSGSDQIMKYPEGPYDLVCVLDCGDVTRMGDILPPDYVPEVNIDHHATNLRFARLNLVDTHAVATVEIICLLLPLMDLELTPTIASALLTGFITDTLGFRTNNMKPEVLRLAANLMEAGADLPVIYREALASHSFEAIRFWGAGLSNLQRDGSLIWTSITQEDRKSVNYPGRDDADLINILTTIDPSDIVMIFVEQPDGRIKVSWRASPGFDVSEIAKSFGGGGHPSASGALIQGSLDKVQELVLSATQALLDGKNMTVN